MNGWTGSLEMRRGRATTEVFDFYGSDHRPILCRLGGQEEREVCKGQGHFHFEEKWLLDKELVPDLACEWSSLGYVLELPKKMKMCESFLTRWAKGKFDKLGKQIQIMRKERQKLLEGKEGHLNARDILEITRKIEKAVEMRLAIGSTGHELIGWQMGTGIQGLSYSGL